MMQDEIQVMEVDSEYDKGSPPSSGFSKATSSSSSDSHPSTGSAHSKHAHHRHHGHHHHHHSHVPSEAMPQYSFGEPQPEFDTEVQVSALPGFHELLKNIGPSISSEPSYLPHFTIPQQKIVSPQNNFQPTFQHQQPFIDTSIQQPFIDTSMTPPSSPSPFQQGSTLTAKRRPSGIDKRQLYCHKCGKIDTPEWRKGPDGPATLCNACGLQWSTSQMMHKRRARPPTSSPVPSPPASPSPQIIPQTLPPYSFSQSHFSIPQQVSSAYAPAPVMPQPQPQPQPQRKIGGLASFLSGDGLLNQHPPKLVFADGVSSQRPQQSHFQPTHQVQPQYSSPQHQPKTTSAKQVLKGEGLLEAYPPSLISVLHRLRDGGFENKS